LTVDVQSAIDINRPVSEVSGYAANPDNAPLWCANRKDLALLKKRLEGIGV
jgi:hypothetical protein